MISAASRPSSAVFFNRQCAGLLKSEIADLFGHGDELLNQAAETMIFVQLCTGALNGFTSRNDVRACLAGYGVG